MGNHSSRPSKFSFSIRSRHRTISYPFPILQDDDNNNKSNTSTNMKSTRNSSNPDAVSLGYYLKPSGLYPTCTWDTRHVARLITRGQLVPRYPGKDDPCEQAREECPICLLVYPLLNTTKCCSARLCTECYLQIRPPRRNRQPCPFCKRKKVQASFKCARSISEMDKEEKDHKRAVEAMKKVALEQQQQQQHTQSLLNCSSTNQSNVQDQLVVTAASTTAATGPTTNSISQSDSSRQSLSLSLSTESPNQESCIIETQSTNDMDEIDQPITLEGCRINILGARDCIRDEYEANDEIFSNRNIPSSWLQKDQSEENVQQKEEEEEDTQQTEEKEDTKSNLSFSKTEMINNMDLLENDSMYGSSAFSSPSSCQQMSGILRINVEPTKDNFVTEKKKEECTRNATFLGRRSLTNRKHTIHLTGMNRTISDDEKQQVQQTPTPLATMVLSEEASLQEAIRRSLCEK